MDVLNVGTNLSFYILLVASVAIGTFCFRYYREHDGIFWDAGTYFILLMVLYVAVPAYMQLKTGVTVVGAPYQTIEFSARYSLYFMVILTIYYMSKPYISRVVLNRRSSSINKHIILTPISNYVIYLLYGAIVTYVLSAFFLNYPGVYQMWSDRARASAFTAAFNGVYKVQFMFALVTSMIVYLSFKNKKNIYILMFFPFLLLNLITTDRDFMFQILLASVGILLITKTKIPVFKLLLASFFIVSIEVFRVAWNGVFGLKNLIFIPGELLFTKQAELFIIDSHASVAFPDLLIYSLGKVMTPQFMSVLFGGIPNFRAIIGAESQLTLGLGGSLLSEVFSFKSYVLYICYPFIAVIYLETINALRRQTGFLGVLIFVFYLISTHAIFRSGIIFTSMDPIYYALYGTGWYWVFRVMFTGRDHHVYA